MAEEKKREEAHKAEKALFEQALEEKEAALQESKKEIQIAKWKVASQAKDLEEKKNALQEAREIIVQKDQQLKELAEKVDKLQLTASVQDF